MLDWIFEGIVNWISSIVSQMMDAVSGLFLQALGTDMTAMEEYFPFVSKAFTVMQYTAWAVLFLVTVWQLFRVFGGPITEAENPWTLLARSSIFALLIGYAKPIFMITLDIARAPYTALMELTMTAEDFTFAGIEQALSNGLTTIVAVVSVVGLLLLVILEISLGWNYFKLLLETVERYIVVGVLCYTSPLAFSMGASKTTAPVFKSWCRMVGSQLLLLEMNVWFLRGFNSSMGQYIGNGGALSTGQGSIFLWLFCALAFLKTAQKFDSYLAAMGLNVAQTGSSMGMELLMAARVISGVGGGAKSAGSFFSKGGSAATGTGAAASGAGAGAFYDAPAFSGDLSEAAQVAQAFPDAADGTTLRTVGDGVIEASGADGGNTMWYNSAYYDEPDAPHTIMQSANGVDWYAMQQHAETPEFESGDAAALYNQGQFQQFMPGYEQQVSSVDGSGRSDGHFEVLHENGSGTMFYDTTQYAAPRGDYQVFEDARGGQWYAIRGEASVERKPVYENGRPVYDGESVRSVSVETVRYKQTPSRFEKPKPRENFGSKPPKRKR